MTRQEHNTFWRTGFAETDETPLRPAGWERTPRTPEGRIGYDVRTEYDDDCLHCVAAVPHVWSEHDTLVLGRRAYRLCTGLDD